MGLKSLSRSVGRASGEAAAKPDNPRKGSGVGS
jgi:hypothetical protein